MTLTDGLKILDDKIKANQGQYDLDREAAKLEKENKKEGHLKRLKNIEGKNEEQLKVIKDQEEKQIQVLTN